jgi:hypothetical protein
VPDVPFKIYDRNDNLTFPMTGYSLPFEIFKFEPNFTTTGNDISDKKVVWNFGDNTLSNDLTAYHSYKYPGTYPVSLTVFKSNGDGTQSSVLSTIKIANYINDVIVLTTNGAPSQVSGQNNNKFYLTRYNSWQTSLSGKNTVILLSVSGNRSLFVPSEKYYNEKDIHFYSTARFAINTDLGLTVVDEVSTNNATIYAAPNGDSISLSLTASYSSVVAGTSGDAYFYYIEDYKLGSPTPSVSPTTTPSVTPSTTPEPSITPSLTPSATPSMSLTPSITPTVTPSITISSSIPSTPTVTPSMSLTPSITPEVTPSMSLTPSITPEVTPSITISSSSL